MRWTFVFLMPMLLGADWPRFLGPDGSGRSPDNVPTEWSSTKSLKWKFDLPGPGSSSPIVVGSRVFVTCFTTEGMALKERYLVCIDRKSGKEKWKKVLPADKGEDPYRGFITDHGYASNTPASDGERVYAFWGKGGVAAYDLDGKELWRKSVGKMSSSRRWGSAASVMLHKEAVIINAAEEGRALFAFDRKTGKELWKTEAEGLELCYGTPAVLKREGREELVLAVAGELWAINPETGKLRWFATTEAEGNLAASVAISGETVVLTGGFPNTRMQAFKAGTKGDATKNALWSMAGSYVPSPVIHEGLALCVNDQGIATAVDLKTGKEASRLRLPVGGGGGGFSRPVYATAVVSGKHLIAVTRRSGTFVLTAGKEIKRVAHNKLDDDSAFNATPAVSDGELFLRSDRALYCIGGKE
jgi:outer membrane protein assembly factor BamB